ncbi:hypothetical protein BIY24_06590 [Halobacteriovorax marinus]|uniref:NAD-dependent epimerase/dehydratase family protein n=1 Tax=Halobacteriovorax marinus TaxID=97084 RepID=UPI000BC340F4|nr:NAD-dependent epimerase/dehydratase family protein [Halobacteriovorax marinus]ATH07623.1 hypothetical protein BIY24_06590 [Halobacteriovorax marinus]
MKFLVFGGTGLVGQSLVEKLSTQHEVHIAARTPNTNSTNFVTREIDYRRFEEFSLQEYDGVYCCLGSTIKKAGSKEAFREVDYDYVLKCFDYAKKSGGKFFCVISALGADHNSRFFYNKVKGEMENSLEGEIRIIIVRPSLLLGKRDEFRALEKVSTLLVEPFHKTLKKILKEKAPIWASEVAESMIELSLEGKTKSPIEYIEK